MKIMRIILLPLLSAIMLMLSFPKPGFWYLAWLAFVPLLLVLPTVRIREAAMLGLLTGCVGSAGIVYWIYPTIYFSTFSALQSITCLVLLSCYMAVYVAVWCAAIRLVWPRWSVLRFSIFGAALWAGLELLRSMVLNGFTWGFVGYSQAEFKSVIQLASWGGVYAVSFMVMLVNIAIAQFIRTRRRMPFILLSAGVVLAIFWGNQMLRENNGIYRPEVVVAGLQGNIDQYKKFDNAYRNEIIAVYTGLAQAASRAKPAVIVWPETAVPGLIPDEGDLSSWIGTLAKETATYHLVGAVYHGSGSDVYNSSLLMTPEGTAAGMHHKSHLVIFGEYVPLRKVFERFFGVLNTIGDLVRGETQEAYLAGAVCYGSTICSENFSGDLVRRFVLNGAEVLVNQTNDAWYGKTSQQEQHFNMTILRAAENRRAVIVAANTGKSGIISPTGMVSDTLPRDTAGFFSGKVAPVRSLTFYTVHGDLFAQACLLAALGVLLAALLGKLNLRLRNMSEKLFDGSVFPLPDK